MTYLDELSRELAAHGIERRARSRILLEVDDHLRSDPEAQARFGSPREVANAFAAELGAQASRRSVVGAFAALGIAGAVYAVSFTTSSFAGARPMTSMLGALAFATNDTCGAKIIVANASAPSIEVIGRAPAKDDVVNDTA